MRARRSALVIALACAATLPATAPAGTDVGFRTVARGDGASSAVTKRGVAVIRSRRTWERTWRRLHAGVEPPPRAPRIDFARRMLVVVTAGQRPTAGHDIRVRMITDRGDRLRVRVRETAPGAGCVVPQVQTAPFHVVRVRRGPESAVLSARVVRTDC